VLTVGKKRAMGHISIDKNCQSIKICRIPGDASGLQKNASHGPVSRDVVALMRTAAASIVVLIRVCRKSANRDFALDARGMFVAVRSLANTPIAGASGAKTRALAGDDEMKK
jgi:hypothetical protein